MHIHIYIYTFTYVYNDDLGLDPDTLAKNSQNFHTDGLRIGGRVVITSGWQAGADVTNAPAAHGAGADVANEI